MVSSQEVVKPGQVIAVIENPAKYFDVLMLEDYLENFDARI
jgi:hypothetical protein